MLTKDEYLARAEADDEWAPGWLALEEAFDALYPSVEPAHLATELLSRAVFGGEDHLDGYSLYPRPDGNQHILTYGMSALYANEEYHGRGHSGWGYEMTMKVRADSPDDCSWAVSALHRLAKYTFTQKSWLNPFQLINGQGSPIDGQEGTALTSFLVVPDTEVPGIDTVHGRVEFLQLVGITQAELDWAAAKAGPTAEERQAVGRQLAERLIDSGNTHLITDVSRTESVV